MTLRDLAYAGRQFRRTPMFTAGIVMSLGFGIGASATVYSWMSGMVVRPLPVVREVDRLITVRPELRNGFGVSLPEYAEWRDQAMSVSGLAAASLSLFAVEKNATTSATTTTPLYGMFVSANYFDLLGVTPGKGRTFLPADDVEGAPPVAVLSHVAWRTHFDATEEVVGRVIRVNGQLVTVVGVAPPRFGGNLAVARFDLWLPIATRPLIVPAERETWKRRDNRWVDAIGRLRPGVTLAQANAEFQEIGRRQAQMYAENIGRGAEAEPLDIGTARQLSPLFTGLVIVTMLVVLLICSNVANLLLTRATARDRELAVRLSLGASRGRLVRQLMMESVILAVMGGAVGVAVATFSDGLLGLLMPPTLVAFDVNSQVDLRFLLFVFAVTGGSVVAFGLAPALLASRVRLVETLKNGAGGSSARGSRLRGTLVVVQFSLALTILVSAALFLRRDRDVNAMDLGYRRGDQVLLVQTEMSLAGYGDRGRWRETMERAVERVAAIQDVRSTALGSFVPLGLMGYWRREVVVPSHPSEQGARDRVLVNAVSNDYFDLMGIELPQGRGFSGQDAADSPAVVVVNEAFAEKYFRGRSPLRQIFSIGGREVEIVGVSRNGRYDYHEIDNDRIPLVYFPWAQSPSTLVTLHVRVDSDPMKVVNEVRAAIHDVDPAIPVLPPVTLVEYSSVPFYISKSALKILTVLGVAGLMLASMGLFSVVSYGVSLRAREIGIRLAVGATRQRIISLVLRGAVQLAAFGALAGIVAAFAITTVMRSQMVILPRGSMLEYVVPTSVLALCAIVAGLVPARRAASVDPSRTLRAE
jgi:predicted permease